MPLRHSGGVQVQTYSLLTSVLEGGLRSMPRFTPSSRPLPTVQEAGLAPDPVRTSVEKRKYLDHTKDRNPNLPDRYESYRRSTNSLFFWNPNFNLCNFGTHMDFILNQFSSALTPCLNKFHYHFHNSFHLKLISTQCLFTWIFHSLKLLQVVNSRAHCLLVIPDPELSPQKYMYVCSALYRQ
jgi:hypothetical protein